MEATERPKQQRSLVTRQKLLDAAVEELLAHGYTNLSTAGVARRARVSRGAQQYHFPFKDELIIEAVRELAERQLGALRGRFADMPDREQRIVATLDATLEAFSGPLFATVLELTLAARDNDTIRDAAREGEALLSRALRETGRRLLADLDRREADLRWAMAVSSVRGFGMLALLGHPAASVQRQWRFTRARLVAMLQEP